MLQFREHRRHRAQKFQHHGRPGGGPCAAIEIDRDPKWPA
jgi:hypothetical protein